MTDIPGLSSDGTTFPVTRGRPRRLRASFLARVEGRAPTDRDSTRGGRTDRRETEARAVRWNAYMQFTAAAIRSTDLIHKEKKAHIDDAEYRERYSAAQHALTDLTVA
ncbi:hypothetical protein GCM10010275_20450 [Streptomyces litmocidini]|nr:hypothetical protein GCM10010275_20450 [Streptomyces litmocidini]